jgi:hypothetical protein
MVCSNKVRLLANPPPAYNTARTVNGFKRTPNQGALAQFGFTQFLDELHLVQLT